MIVENCCNCKYWGPYVESPPDSLIDHKAGGYCRRHAPEIVVMTISRIHDHAESEWPTSRAGDYCGDYSPTRGGT